MITGYIKLEPKPWEPWPKGTVFMIAKDWLIGLHVCVIPAEGPCPMTKLLIMAADRIIWRN